MERGQGPPRRALPGSSCHHNKPQGHSSPVGSELSEGPSWILGAKSFHGQTTSGAHSPLATEQTGASQPDSRGREEVATLV